MTDQTTEIDTQSSTNALLQLCKRLERAWDLADIINAMSPVVEQVLGYPNVWLGVFGDDPGIVNIIEHRTSGVKSSISHQCQSMDIPIAGDSMLEEIMTANHVVVVEDARTDPRTNKQLVAQLQNRTIINVPLILADQRLGSLGMGTYGDKEGVRPPSPWQIEFMQTVAGHVAVALDRVRFMQARKKAEDALYHEKERLQVTLHAISDAVIATNANGELLYINPVAERLTGWTMIEAAGHPCGQVFRVSDRSTSGEGKERDLVAEAVAAAETKRYPYLDLHQRKGAGIEVEAAASPIRDVDGEVQGVVLVFRDVTEQLRLSRKIEFQATHDELTGLGNRRAFEQALTLALEQTRDTTIHHVVFYLDLDEFKVVNDTCGHTAGDELLRQVARLFADLLPEDECLCRIGGDEFGILLTNVSMNEALAVADRLQEKLGAYRFAWHGRSFAVGVSIGAVALDTDSESVGALLQCADSACYVAKEAGRNRVHVYSSDDPALARRYGVMKWVSRIEHALQNDRLVLFAQPIIRINGPSSSGMYVEILLRMLDKQGALIPPGQFLPAAERYHLASRLDRWVVTNALKWVAEHRGQIDQCAINLSGQSVGDPEFLAFVREVLPSSASARAKLCFEITETAAISNLWVADQFIQTFRALGCRFSLDDFGSGLSSFAYLRNLPVDSLKIDGQFVKDIGHDQVSLAMVKSIHEIGCLMGKQTIAEQVENEQSIELLREVGVNYVQGYSVGRPVPLDQIFGNQ